MCTFLPVNNIICVVHVPISLFKEDICYFCVPYQIFLRATNVNFAVFILLVDTVHVCVHMYILCNFSRVDACVNLSGLLFLDLIEYVLW